MLFSVFYNKNAEINYVDKNNESCNVLLPDRRFGADFFQNETWKSQNQLSFLNHLNARCYNQFPEIFLPCA